MANSFKNDGRMIFAIFIGAIIAVVFMANIADSIFTQTNTATQTNLTVTVSAINVSQAVAGRELIALTSITNETNVSRSLQNEGLNLSTRIVNGAQTVALTANDSSGSVGNEVNLTYTYNPDGFIDNAGARSIVTLILIIAGLAIVVFVIVQIFGSEALINITRRRKD